MASPSGPPLSPARRAGGLLFLSGQLPRGADGAIAGSGMLEQARLALSNLKKLLESEGCSPDDVVKVTAWITDAADMAAFNLAYCELFDTPYPARSTVVSALVAPGALVEIEAIAQLPG
ncbi:RidA family protein [Altericroceibacterium spongiae]|uniref:RidA family protein n=2 Tax=Altericroceibacterium spongiae TaxID=2320269 RepID=A0A420EE21_9SPHN|nr:RidA family protein [Altericroceibacterium spongiae]